VQNICRNCRNSPGFPGFFGRNRGQDPTKPVTIGNSRFSGLVTTVTTYILVDIAPLPHTPTYHHPHPILEANTNTGNLTSPMSKATNSPGVSTKVQTCRNCRNSPGFPGFFGRNQELALMEPVTTCFPRFAGPVTTVTTYSPSDGSPV
jgi:hypothetical protein